MACNKINDTLIVTTADIHPLNNSGPLSTFCHFSQSVDEWKNVTYCIVKVIHYDEVKNCHSLL